MKKVFACVLALCMVLSMIPAVAGAFSYATTIASGQCGDDLTWELIGGQCDLYIRGTGEMYDYDVPGGNLPPWYEYKDKYIDDVIVEDGVTSIGDYAFYEFPKCIYDISGTVRSVGYAAFSMSEEYSCAIQTPIRWIGDYAYAGCTNMVYILLGSSVDSVGAYAYSGCKNVERIDIERGLESVGDNAFEGCTSIYKCTFPDTVKSLGNNIFLNADVLLKEITFLGDAPSIGPTCFATVTSRVYYPADNPTWTEEVRQNYGGNLTWIPYEGEEPINMGVCGDEVVWDYDPSTKTLRLYGTGDMYDYKALSSGHEDELYAPWVVRELDVRHVIVEEGVTSIGERAFSRTNVETVSLPEGLKKIGSAGFGSTKLTKVELPYGLESLGKGAFSNCTELKEITFNGVRLYSENLFWNVTATAYYPSCFPAYAENPNGYGGNITWVPFEQQPRVLYTGSCGDALTWDYYDDGRLHIYGEGPMYDYTWEDKAPWLLISNQILRVDIDEGVTTIGDHAFNYYNLGYRRSVNFTFPSTITKVGENAIYNGLTTAWLTFQGDAPQFADKAFDQLTAVVYFPEGNDTWTREKMLSYGGETLYLFKTADGGYGGLCGDSAVWTVDTAAETMTVSGSGDMWDWQINYGMTSSAPWTHWILNELFTVKKLVVSEGITGIGQGSFMAMRDLAQISLPKSLKSIGASAFEKCHYLTEVTVPNSVTAIGNGAFRDCFYLADVTFGSGIKELPVDVLFYCINLKNVTIPAGVTAIRSGAVGECNNLEKVVFTGSQTQWNAVKVEDRNEPLQKAEVVTLGNPYNPFVDVKADRFEDAILWAYKNGITTGTGDGTTFSPESACTRKQIVTFLWRAAGEPEPKSMENPFTDVKHDRFEKAILWAYYEGITTGTGDGSTFSPEDTCTRKQIVTFLWRYHDKPAPESTEINFTDVKNDRFAPAIVWAAEQGITTGTGDGSTFSPEDPCTRKQIVTFLYRDMV